MTSRTILFLLLATRCAAALSAATRQPPPRYKDYYHSYSLRQQLESQESYNGFRGPQRAPPTGPSAPAAAAASDFDPAAAGSAPAAAVAPAPAEATPAPAVQTLPPVPPSGPQLPEAQQRLAYGGANTVEQPRYYYGHPLQYEHYGWPSGYAQPLWGRDAGMTPRWPGAYAQHHGGYFVHPGLIGVQHNGLVLGHHGLASHHGGFLKSHHGLVKHHGGFIKGLHGGLATHHGGLVKSHHGFAEHHGGLVKGHHGLAEHHGGLVKSPHGLVEHHGGLLVNKLGGVVGHTGGVLFHAKDATGGEQQFPEEDVATAPAARSAEPQYYPSYRFHHPAPYFHLWKPPTHDGVLRNGGAPPPVPAMPGKIKGGADVSLFNVHGHGSQKGLVGETAHKYKHYNLDLGYGCWPHARPLHLLHADSGYDLSQYAVGGGASADANVAHGLGGSVGLL